MTTSTLQPRGLTVVEQVAAAFLLIFVVDVVGIILYAFVVLK